MTSCVARSVKTGYLYVPDLKNLLILNWNGDAWNVIVHPSHNLHIKLLLQINISARVVCMFVSGQYVTESLILKVCLDLSWFRAVDNERGITVTHVVAKVV